MAALRKPGGRHPRPQLTRAEWTDLCGAWDYAFDDADIGVDEAWYEKFPGEGAIMVPYPPESVASGIGDPSFHPIVWYQTRCPVVERRQDERILLHVGACDYRASLWCNGSLVGTHEGGHTPFSFDITQFIRADGELELTIRASDDPADLQQPRGKQDWNREPHGVWYPRTSGLWQSVWLERVPSRSISALTWRFDTSAATVSCDVTLRGRQAPAERVAVRLTVGDELLAEAEARSVVGTCDVELAIPALRNGVDRTRLFWSPESPTLIQASVEIIDGERKIIDTVGSYVGIRDISSQDGHVLLNGRPYFLRLVLEQGVWPDTHLAAPSEEALRNEVLLIKELGFNGVRVHQKIEDPRFLAYCDEIGLVVWEEMPSCYEFGDASILRLVSEWSEAILRDRSHPSIVCWVPLNESWGVPALPSRRDQRSLARALVELTRALDPSRLVVSNDGWEHVGGDVVTIHDYGPDQHGLTERYGQERSIGEMVTRGWPGPRRVVLSTASVKSGVPVIVSEFGGISVTPESNDTEEWVGYGTVGAEDELLQRFEELVTPLLASTGIAGFCYTQLVDTFQEKNGLLRADRSPKVSIGAIRAILSRPAASVPREEIDMARETARRREEDLEHRDSDPMQEGN